MEIRIGGFTSPGQAACPSEAACPPALCADPCTSLGKMKQDVGIWGHFQQDRCWGLSSTFSRRLGIRCRMAALLALVSALTIIAYSSLRVGQPAPDPHLRTFDIAASLVVYESHVPRACPISYLPVEKAIEEMSRAGAPDSGVLKNLTYVTNQTAVVPTPGHAGSQFGGFPTLVERMSSFIVKESMHVHCGFVKGSPGVNTGFDISAGDLQDMEACNGILVATTIFGNYDQFWQPTNISEHAIETVCFFAFVDEYTACINSQDGSTNILKQMGLWRIVVVRNLPYTDTRRVGEIPKQLLHRLFPNVQYSIWQDSKLQLSGDPYQILERFLWRSGDVFAISNHPDRADAYDEADATKSAKKGDVWEIDSQMQYYRHEGWPRYSPAKLPIISDVPDSCVMIRRHTPLVNLFSCLWFNELDRFSPRDQLSFGIVRDKLMFQTPLRVNMFKDCERRNIAAPRAHKCWPNGPCKDGTRCTSLLA